MKANLSETCGRDQKGERMKNPILRKLYTEEELQNKINEYTVKCEKSCIEKDYQSVASRYYDIGCLFELLEDEEQSDYYYQKILEIWNAHPEKISYHMCVSALVALRRPGEAFEIVLAHARSWDLRSLANFYDELGRSEEARLLYAGMATYSVMLSRSYSFWQSHYLQEAADLCEKAQNFEMAQVYNQRARETWEKTKNNVKNSLNTIEEAWLYEEIGYIYEKADKISIAMDYYKEAKSKYEAAYLRDPTSVFAHQVDGDWDCYLGFFVKQIPDFRLIFFRPDGPEENDYRRIKYRILNLEIPYPKSGGANRSKKSK